MSNTDNTGQLEEMKKAIKDAVKSNLDELVEGNMKKKGYKKDESEDSDEDDEKPVTEAKKKKKKKKSEDDPCWDGYVQYGMKKKNGKEVPNCVKESELTDAMKQELLEMEEDEDEYLDDMEDDDTDVDTDDMDDDDDEENKS